MPVKNNYHGLWPREVPWGFTNLKDIFFSSGKSFLRGSHGGQQNGGWFIRFNFTEAFNSKGGSPGHSAPVGRGLAPGGGGSSHPCRTSSVCRQPCSYTPGVAEFLKMFQFSFSSR